MGHGAGADGDAVLRHFLPREGGQRRRQIWQDAVAGLQQRHLNVASPNGAIETGAGAEQIGDLAGHFDAAEAPAHDDHREQAILKNGIGLHLGALEQADQVIAQQQGIADGLERPAVRGHAGNDVEIHGRAAGQHELIVRLTGGPAGRRLVVYVPRGEIDPGHGRGAAEHLARHLADRPYHVHRVD